MFRGRRNTVASETLEELTNLDDDIEIYVTRFWYHVNDMDSVMVDSKQAVAL